MNASRKSVMAAVATAFVSLGSVGSAHALAISVQVSGAAYTPPSPLPFATVAIPGGPASNAFVSTASIGPLAGTSISSITFTGGPTTTSGVYAGNMLNVALSPFGSTNSSTNYLAAGGGGGVVTVNYSAPQTSLNILWGTVDTAPGQNSLLTLNVGGQTITGADIAAAALAEGYTLTNGQDDVAVEITGLNPFTTLTAADTAAPAFEFDVATAIPEPISLGLVGVGLFGLCMARRKSCTKA